MKIRKTRLVAALAALLLLCCARFLGRAGEELLKKLSGEEKPVPPPQAAKIGLPGLNTARAPAADICAEKDKKGKTVFVGCNGVYD